MGLLKGLGEGLSVKIHDLENQARDREGLLGVREGELNDLRSLIGNRGERIAQMESVTKQAETMAASEAERAEQAKQINGSLQAEIAALRAQLQEKEEAFYPGRSVINGLEESLRGKIRDLQNQVREKDELLELHNGELVERGSLVQAKEEEIKRLQEKMSVESKKLSSEIQEKKVLLAARERDAWRSNRRWKLWKQGVGG